ncbi:polysaccharide biosynthesis tyrosine autokinase [Luteipulveratus flavus]|uniref:Polysaccharide biosynthesis tyrosine autokinase n=1 Tax=Luteipulveratus flavus TaxID=3031728 RepID=A0ABT6CC50_9MICO|nr:polysaccharide biosynthesis tyrosine autokinase [Luteipulveratus sp. YIM 133296]MDF8266480.1 polysaccharide biosynthesis tyrosine autokinase [Luteipulveratus sp. YIM 133296]
MRTLTFKQVIHVLWQRALLIVACTVLAGGAAVAYMQTRHVTYSSAAVVRVAVSMSGDQRDPGQPFIDTGPAAVTSETSLRKAAQILGVSQPASLTSVVQATPDPQNQTMTVAAVGDTPAQAQERAGALAQGYVAALAAQQQNNINSLQRQQSSLRTQLDSITKKMRANGDLSGDSSDSGSGGTTSSDPALTAQLNAVAASYQTISQQLSNLSVAGAPAAVQRAPGAGASTASSSTLVLASALLAGLMAGCGLALLRDQFDTRLRGGAHIESLTGVPILAQLATESSARGEQTSLPAEHRRHTPFLEGIRALRTSVQVQTKDVRSPVVVITSPEPGDGKSFVCANLAIAWARTGKRVLLVEGDLRKPTTAAYVGCTDQSRGLATLLRAALDDRREVNERDLADVVQPTTTLGLSVLAAGSVGAQPADLLASDALGAALQQMRGLADVVIVDSPPILGLADGLILAREADGVVVVASAQSTRQNVIAETVKTLRDNDARVLGVALNHTQLKSLKGYNAYYSGEDDWNVEPAASSAPQPPTAPQASTAPVTAAPPSTAPVTAARVAPPAAPQPVEPTAPADDAVIPDDRVTHVDLRPMRGPGRSDGSSRGGGGSYNGATRAR